MRNSVSKPDCIAVIAYSVQPRLRHSMNIFVLDFPMPLVEAVGGGCWWRLLVAGCRSQAVGRLLMVGC